MYKLKKKQLVSLLMANKNNWNKCLIVFNLGWQTMYYNFVDQPIENNVVSSISWSLSLYKYAYLFKCWNIYVNSIIFHVMICIVTNKQEMHASIYFYSFLQAISSTLFLALEYLNNKKIIT